LYRKTVLVLAVIVHMLKYAQMASRSLSQRERRHESMTNEVLCFCTRRLSEN